MHPRPQNCVAQYGVGRLKTSRTVCASIRSTRSSFLGRPGPRGVAVAGSAAYSQLKTTSSAVKGLPSCQSTPGLSFQVTERLSRDTPPFWRLGISRARMGTRAPSGPNDASGS